MRLQHFTKNASKAPVILQLLEIPPVKRDMLHPEAWIAVARDLDWQPGDTPPQCACRRVLDQLLRKLPDSTRSTLTLVHDTQGAPLLSGSRHRPPKVSMAHTGPWFVVGLSQTACIGVDIEQHAKQRNFQAIADYLGWHDAIDSAADFYSRWTLWEAYVKCTGKSVLEQESADFQEVLIQAQNGANSPRLDWRVFQGEAENKVQFAVVLRFPFKGSLSCTS